MKVFHHHASSFLLYAAAMVNAIPNPQYNNFLPADYIHDAVSLQPPPQALKVAFTPDSAQLTELSGNDPVIQPGISIPESTAFQLVRARRQTTKGASGGCGLPICRGEVSYYRFGPRDVVFCGGRGQHSSSAKIVALPAWFMNRGYCGKYLTLFRTDAKGKVHTTRALISDKCPNGSCHPGNNRIDLSEAAFLALGGTHGAGVLRDVRWRIA